MCDDDKKAEKQRHTPKPNLKQMNRQVLSQKACNLESLADGQSTTTVENKKKLKAPQVTEVDIKQE